MIAARVLPAPEPQRRERERRHSRAHRSVALRRTTWLRIVASVAVPFVLVMAYVAMLAHVTSLGYSYASERTALQRARAEHVQLEDELARLESPQRLAALGRRLKMTDPGDELVLRLGGPPKRTHLDPLASGAAFLTEAAGSILRQR
ncbi:MAG: hypothetical protein KGM44_09550 [bacterium]|nr:hypothetical protein [bacterium]